MENPAILLRRLNPYCARAMEGAASLCQTRAHAEILPEHWLLKLLEQGEGDLTVLARRYEWDMDTIWQDMLGFLDSLPRSVRSRPQLSDGVQSLMQDARCTPRWRGRAYPQHSPPDGSGGKTETAALRQPVAAADAGAEPA